MIFVAIVAIIAAVAIPNYLRYQRMKSRASSIDALVDAERAHRKKSGSWLAFENRAGAESGLGIAFDAECELTGVAAGSNAALVLTVLCPRIASEPLEKKVEP